MSKCNAHVEDANQSLVWGCGSTQRQLLTSDPSVISVEQTHVRDIHSPTELAICILHVGGEREGGEAEAEAAGVWQIGTRAAVESGSSEAQASPHHWFVLFLQCFSASSPAQQ